MNCGNCGTRAFPSEKFGTGLCSKCNEPLISEKNRDSSPGNMGPVKAYTSFLKNYFNFSGRASLSEYWWVLPINILLGFIPIVGLLVGLLLIIPGVAVTVRRLHDTGRSGWHILVVLIPFIGWIALIWWNAQQGDRFPNGWGEPPAATSS